MRSSPFDRLLAPALMALWCAASPAQDTPYAGVGQAPTAAELKAWDIAVTPNGDGLPPGQGTARQGEPLYHAKCAVCHGPDMEGRRDLRVGRLAGGIGSLGTDNPVQSVGSYSPFATTVWDYINRAMPRFAEGTLAPNEVYALTAYILFKNGIIGQDEVMNARTLPQVEMPNRYGFIPSDLDEIADIEGRGCRNGHCP